MMIASSANDTERDRVRNGRSRDWVSSVSIAKTRMMMAVAKRSNDRR